MFFKFNDYNVLSSWAPLDQFWTRKDIALGYWFGLDIQSNYFVFVCIYSFMYLSILFILESPIKNYNFLTHIIFILFELLKTILRSITIIRRNEQFPTYYYLFLFLILSNMFGLLPFCYTVTSSFVTTFMLAFTYFFGLNVVGIWKRQWELLSIFFSDGVPNLISFLLVPIELVSYIARVFSLSIRLFANMMSGHALLKILIGFCWLFICSGNIINLALVVLPWLIVSMVFMLEILIAFLQSYVFLTLLAIYINDLVSSH